MTNHQANLMYKFRVFLLVLLSTSILPVSSCKNKDRLDVASSKYSWFNFENQGWKSKRVTQFVGDINYTATEVPLQYYILKSIGSNYASVDSIYKANDRERVIEIEFQHADQVDLLLSDYTNKSYKDAVKYMAFNIRKDFKVITSSHDTISCAGVNFERNFKVAPFKRLLLHFNDINPDDNIKLVYQDELFGNGIIKFNFTEAPLKL